MKHLGVLLALVFFASPLAAYAARPAEANVCVLLVAGQNGVATMVQRSCDGGALESLAREHNAFVEELSGQLGSLYNSGLRLINCQVNNTALQVEYLCVVAR